MTDSPHYVASSGAVPKLGWRNRPAAATSLRVVRRPAGAVSLGFLFLLVLVAVFAPVLAPQDPNAQSLSEHFQGVSTDHLLGTDDFGRDVLSRLIYATRVTVVAPLVAVGLALLLGLPAGLIAGYRRGNADAIFSRISDTLLSIPPIVAAIAIVAVLGPGLVRIMIAIGIVYAPRVFRVVRSAVLSVSEETYILSCRAIGMSTPRVLWVHCLPNVLAPLLVQTSLLMGFALLAESTLSFLGIGIQLPEASWGSMLRSASQNQFQAPYAVIPPGAALTLTILALNTLGDVIRDSVSDRG